MENELGSAQRGMERSMLVISLRDRKRGSWIREKTKVKDILVAIKEQKWRWAGHVARREDNRWSKRLTDWTPREGKKGGNQMEDGGMKYRKPQGQLGNNW